MLSYGSRPRTRHRGRSVAISLALLCSRRKDSGEAFVALRGMAIEQLRYRQRISVRVRPACDFFDAEKGVSFSTGFPSLNQRSAASRRGRNGHALDAKPAKKIPEGGSARAHGRRGGGAARPAIRLHRNACQNVWCIEAETRDAIDDANPTYHLQSSMERIRPAPVFGSVARTLTISGAQCSTSCDEAARPGRPKRKPPTRKGLGHTLRAGALYLDLLSQNRGEVIRPVARAVPATQRPRTLVRARAKVTVNFVPI